MIEFEIWDKIKVIMSDDYFVQNYCNSKEEAEKIKQQILDNADKANRWDVWFNTHIKFALDIGTKRLYSIPKLEKENQQLKEKIARLKSKDFLEKLTELEHDQWIAWSKHLSTKEKLSQKTVERWEKLWCEYNALPESEKDHDRVWSKLIQMKILKEIEE